MSNIDKLARTIFVLIIAVLAVFLTSGVFVLVSVATNGNDINKQITISMYEQHDSFKPIEKSMLPGEVIDFDLSLKSSLVEKVKYDLTFSDYIETKNDRYLYVSIINSKQENLVNNTLDEVFTQHISVSGILDSNESEKFHISITLSSFFKGCEMFDFVLNVDASGRIFN